MLIVKKVDLSNGEICYNIKISKGNKWKKTLYSISTFMGGLLVGAFTFYKIKSFLQSN